MRNVRARCALGVGLTVAAAVVLSGCNKKDAEAPPPVRPVLSTVIAPRAAEAAAPFIGTVQPRYQTSLGFRSAGRMVSRAANVGDRVSKGQLLASLDPLVVRFALTSAQADLANAQAQLANATATDQRQRILLKTDAVSKAQVDQAVATKDMAQAKVNQAQAVLAKAQEQFGYTELRSDYDGVITSWSLEVGQIVSAGQTVVTVARPDVRDAVFDLPDDLMAQVAADATFSVALQVDSTVVATGQAREIAPQADAATRTRHIRLTLKDPPDAFRLGTTVTITLTARPAAAVVTVPATAILDKDGQANVWLVAPDSTAKLTPVVLGARNGDIVTVAQGLVSGDRVITAGVHSLSPGRPVTLIEP